MVEGLQRPMVGQAFDALASTDEPYGAAGERGEEAIVEAASVAEAETRIVEEQSGHEGQGGRGQRGGIDES